MNKNVPQPNPTDKAVIGPKSVLLAWALTDGVPRQAREFVGVAVNARPRAICPCCEEPVSWKAGDVNTPHVAHLPDANCPTSAPETATHYNAKMKLAEALSQRRQTAVSIRCSRGHDVTFLWSPRWDCATPERFVVSVRPDVTLSLDGSATAGIEVFYSHAVDIEKAAKMANMRLPWLELTSADIEEWSTEHPLPVHNADTSTHLSANEQCSQCTTRRMAESEKRRHDAANDAARIAAIVEQEAKWLSEDTRADVSRCYAPHTLPRTILSKYAINRNYYTSITNTIPKTTDMFKRRMERADLLRRYPPSLRVAISAVTYKGSAAIGAIVMSEGARARLLRLDRECDLWRAEWMALEFAMELLHENAAGRQATIHTDSRNIACRNTRKMDFAMAVVKTMEERYHSLLFINTAKRFLDISEKSKELTENAESAMWIKGLKSDMRKLMNGSEK